MTVTELLEVLLADPIRRAVVLCDGTPPSDSLIRSCLAETDLFVCADGAGWPHDRLPRRPDLVVGDFDTLIDVPPSSPDGTRYLRHEHQDTTDGEKALETVEAEGCDQALLLGATGGHLDHTLANCALLERFAGRITTAIVNDHGVTLRLGTGHPVRWALPIGTFFSLAAIGRPASGVTVDGARWPIRGGDITWGGPATISNQTVEPMLAIRLNDGALLVTIRLPDPGSA